jgi:hypothetical protein
MVSLSAREERATFGFEPGVWTLAVEVRVEEVMVVVGLRVILGVRVEEVVVEVGLRVILGVVISASVMARVGPEVWSGMEGMSVLVWADVWADGGGGMIEGGGVGEIELG